jgi:hypothetical protein
MDVGLVLGTVAGLPDMAGDFHAERIGRGHDVAMGSQNSDIICIRIPFAA